MYGGRGLAGAWRTPNNAKMIRVPFPGKVESQADTTRFTG